MSCNIKKECRDAAATASPAKSVTSVTNTNLALAGDKSNDFFASDAENRVKSPRLQEALVLLDQIPADAYEVWFEVGCALKNLGASYENFRKWSATS